MTRHTPFRGAKEAPPIITDDLHVCVENRRFLVGVKAVSLY